jgi:hypothetical protein
VLMMASTSFGQVALGDVIGTIVQYKTLEPVVDARVFIIDQDKRYNAKSDLDGRFKISAIPPGTYQLLVCKNGDTLKAKLVDVPMDGFADAGVIQYTNNILELPTIVISKADQGIRLEKGFLPVPKLSHKEISTSAVKFNIKDLAISMTTDVKKTDDGSLVFRGARKGDMLYYVDGMKVVGELNLPSTSIYQMMVYSGGLPAQFGDTMGGVIAIESKGYFQLLREYESMQLKMGL